MKSIQNIIALFVLLLFIAACSSKEEHAHHDNNDVEKKHDHELVRKGIIDVESIDINRDEKLYECPMDWNVLSDEKGDCPTCGMNLKEYSLDGIKSNLDKYGYNYKK